MAIDLNKQTEKVKFVLEKRNLNNILCEVVFVLDCSGSAEWLYKNGTMQKVTEYIFPIAFKVDRDKQLGFYLFDSSVKETGEMVTEANYADYIQKYVLNNRKLSLWGGTNYAPVVEKIVESVKPAVSKGLFGFGKKAPQDSVPTLVIFLTDGENGDERKADEMFNKAQSENIYWQLVGIGTGCSFRFIEKMGDKYPNVGFCTFPNIEKTSDDDLYSALLNDEFAQWAQKFIKA